MISNSQRRGIIIGQCQWINCLRGKWIRTPATCYNKLDTLISIHLRFNLQTKTTKVAAGDTFSTNASKGRNHKNWVRLIAQTLFLIITHHE